LKYFDGSTGWPIDSINHALHANTGDNRKLYQIFSSEIDFRRDDVLSRLSQSNIKLEDVATVSGVRKKYKNQSEQQVTPFSPTNL